MMSSSGLHRFIYIKNSENRQNEAAKANDTYRKKDLTVNL